MRRTLIYLLIIVAVTAIVFTLIGGSVGRDEEVSIDEVIAMTARGEVDRIEVKGDVLTVMTASGETLSSRKESGSSIIEILQRAGIDPITSRVEIVVKGQSGLSSFVGVMINFLPLIIFGAVLLFMMRSGPGQYQPDLQLRA